MNVCLLCVLFFTAKFTMQQIVIRYFTPPSVTACYLEPWSREVGFSFFHGAITVKLYRIYAEFQTRKAHRVWVRDKDLLKYLSAIVFVTIGYMAAWTALVSDGVDALQQIASIMASNGGQWAGRTLGSSLVPNTHYYTSYNNRPSYWNGAGSSPVSQQPNSANLLEDDRLSTRDDITNMTRELNRATRTISLEQSQRNSLIKMLLYNYNQSTSSGKTSQDVANLSTTQRLATLLNASSPLELSRTSAYTASRDLFPSSTVYKNSQPSYPYSSASPYSSGSPSQSAYNSMESSQSLSSSSSSASSSSSSSSSSYNPLQPASYILEEKLYAAQHSYSICRKLSWDYVTEAGKQCTTRDTTQHLSVQQITFCPLLLSFLGEIVFLLTAVYLTWRIRNARHEIYVEKWPLSISVYCELITSSTLYCLRHFLWNYLSADHIFLLYLIRCHLTVSVGLGLIFVPKVSHVTTHKF